MCSSEAKVTMAVEASAFSKLNARPVLQPTCNRTLDRRNSLKKPSLQKPPPPPPSSTPTTTATTKSSTTTTTPPPPSPKSKSPRPRAIKRASTTTDTSPSVTTTITNTHTNALLLNFSSDKIVIPRNTATATPKATTSSLERIKKSKSFKEGEASLSYSSSLILHSPGSIAAVRREQMALQHAQRKMRIAHYGRSKSAKFESKVVPLLENATPNPTDHIDDHEEQRRCSFITPTTGPVYVAYHDEEWGVPVHDDNMLFELLVLSGAQVGSDWSSILKKRQDFRDAFSGFDAETVARFSDKQMMSISAEYNIDISRVRGVVDNSNRILEVKKDMGSFNKYIWGFVNHKAISTQYKFGHKIPVKTSKSESISKDMVRRGFRFVGPTVVHSFMQAAGLTNDHLITCHRHLPCTLLGARPARGGLGTQT